MERPLLVTDKGVVAAGLAESALAYLDNAVVFADDFCRLPLTRREPKEVVALRSDP